MHLRIRDGEGGVESKKEYVEGVEERKGPSQVGFGLKGEKNREEAHSIGKPGEGTLKKKKKVWTLFGVKMFVVNIPKKKPQGGAGNGYANTKLKGFCVMGGKKKQLNMGGDGPVVGSNAVNRCKKKEWSGVEGKDRTKKELVTVSLILNYNTKNSRARGKTTVEQDRGKVKTLNGKTQKEKDTKGG